MSAIRIERHGFTGGLWIAGWLFTIGFFHLTFFQGVVGVVIWPYYAGVGIRALMR